MTREVVTVGPETSAKYAGELMAEHGFAALPVVDGDDQLVGMVAEADVLRDRLPDDPRLHARRDVEASADVVLPLLVRGVMTTSVQSVPPSADVADIARLFVDGHLRSVPVVDHGTVVGIVSRRDILRVLVRPDADIRADALRLVEAYTGDVGSWDVQVTEGVTSVRRIKGAPGVSWAVEESALHRLLRTVPGVVAAHVLRDVPAAREAASWAAHDRREQGHDRR